MVNDLAIDTMERDHVIRETKLARKKAEILTSLRMNKNLQAQIREEREALIVALDDIDSQIREEQRAWAKTVKNLAKAEEVTQCE